MKTARIDRKSVKTEPVTFMTTASEKEETQRFADEKGITMSALCRMALKDFMKNANN